MTPDPSDADLFLEHSRKGDAAWQAGCYDEAALQYYEACRADPGSAAGRYNLARALAQLGRLDDAIAGFQAALQLDPKLAFVRYSLACCLQSKGLGEAAVREYEQFLSNAPASAERLVADAASRIAELKSKRPQEPPAQGATLTLSAGQGTLTAGLCPAS